MKYVILILAGAAVFAGICIHAEESKNLVVNGNAAAGSDNWQGCHAYTVVPLEIVTGGPDGANCFEVTDHSWVNSIEHIPVDPSSQYRLTGWFKSANDMVNNVCVGLLLFDESNRPIDATSVNVLEKSETILTADAENGETVIKVKDASAWEPLFQNKLLTIAFDADDSGGYKDLPNSKCHTVKNLEKKDGVWEATLAKPILDSFSAKTKVRAHVTSPFCMLAFEMKNHLPDWTEYSGVIEPMVKSGAPRNAFWPGTKYVRILLLANWGQNNGEKLQFGNISLEKVGPEK
ncbi:MAG: hypothetical protein WC765_04875 [Phycisphaerae bacterium]|jgi:hypothetical protein